MTRPPAPDVDDLREQLRSLGYLDARVDRFVLGAAGGTDRPARLALEASARVGLLAGALLGPAAAIGLRARAPALVTNTTDAAVAALYLSILFSLAAAGVVGLATWAGTAVARRAARRPDFSRRAATAAAVAGVVVALVSVAYLTLWWRAAGVDTGAASRAWTAGALVVGVAISLLLGHAVTLTIMAVLARLGLAGTLRRGLPLSNRRAVTAMAVTASAGAMALLIASAPPAPAPTPPLTARPTGQRVLVLAIDGVDRATLERLVIAGRLPNLAPLITGAAVGLRTIDTTDPARVWTTVATGQPPDRHGIRALEQREVAGLEGRLQSESTATSMFTRLTDLLRLTRPSIATGTERRVPAFWEVAARAGFRTAVVHWWATWPAPPDQGIVVSDRAVVRLERGGEPAGEIEPASLHQRLTAGWPARRAEASRLARQAVSAGDAGVASVVERAATLDAMVAGVAGDLSTTDLDLVAFYLPGLDIAQHALLGSTDSRGGSLAERTERIAALERYYAWLDGLVEPLLKTFRTPGSNVVLIALPGRVLPPASGLLAIAGPAARPDRVDMPPVEIAAVAPTILHLLGVPMARDLAGAPVLPLMAEPLRVGTTDREVATYGPRIPPARPAGRPLDQEMIERMRSLGYVGSR